MLQIISNMKNIQYIFQINTGITQERDKRKNHFSSVAQHVCMNISKASREMYVCMCVCIRR